MNSFFSLLAEIRGCTRCAEHLPHGVKPILQIRPQARVLIAGQAPGRKTHESGLPFDDASGDRLREWMGVTCETFYDSRKIAILPMGFCFPGKGKSGDLPPRPECAQTWHDQLAGHLRYLEVTLVVGRFAQAYYMNEGRLSLTETVRNWQSYGPKFIPLPHPSPRNNIWLSRNPWFEEDLLPMLKRRLSAVLES